MFKYSNTFISFLSKNFLFLSIEKITFGQKPVIWTMSVINVSKESNDIYLKLFFNNILISSWSEIFWFCKFCSNLKLLKKYHFFGKKSKKNASQFYFILWAYLYCERVLFISNPNFKCLGLSCQNLEQKEKKSKN
jgi:hypothetical protein